MMLGRICFYEEIPPYQSEWQIIDFMLSLPKHLFNFKNSILKNALLDRTFDVVNGINLQLYSYKVRSIHLILLVLSKYVL